MFSGFFGTKVLSMGIKKTPQFLEEFFVNLLGFEPRLAESKSDVLPLHHKSI
jgi:hypothetical protein